jgi:salicylate 5-hydroxylase small subunit
MSGASLKPSAALRQAVVDLYADYAAALSNDDFERWPDFFVDDCLYKVQARENVDRGLPLAAIAYESRRMLEDRVYGIRNTLFHQPYYQRIVIGPPRVLRVEARADQIELRCESHYAVFRTKANGLSEVFNVGRTADIVVCPQDAHEKGVFEALPGEACSTLLRFQVKWAIFDSELIPNSLIYPI